MTVQSIAVPAAVEPAPPPAPIGATRRQVTLRTGFSLGSRLLSVALGAVVIGVLTRHLGPSRWGDFAFLLGIVSLVAPVLDFGTTHVATREMARRPQDGGQILAGLLLMNVVAGVFSGVVVLVAGFLTLPPAAALAAIPLALSLPLTSLSAFQAAAQARFRPEIGALATLVQSVLWLGVVIALVVLDAPLLAFGAAFAGAQISQALLTWALARSMVRPVWTNPTGEMRLLLRASATLGLIGLFTTAHYRLDAVLLRLFLGSTALAGYAAAYRLVDVFQVLPATLTTVFLPWFSRAASIGETRRKADAALRWTLLFSAPVALGSMALSGDICQLLFGAEIGPGAAVAFRYLSLAFLAIALGYVYDTLALSLDLMPLVLRVSAAATAFNLVMNLVFLRRYGAQGAAVITLVTQVMVTGGVAVIVHRRLAWRPALARWAPPVVMAAVMAGVVAVADLPLVAGVGLGGVLYLSMLAATHTVTIAELRSLVSRADL